MEGSWPSSFLNFRLKNKRSFSFFSLLSRGRQLVAKNQQDPRSFQNEDFLYSTPKIFFFFRGVEVFGRRSEKGLVLFNRPRTYTATRFYKSTWGGDQRRRSFSLFFLSSSLWLLLFFLPPVWPPSYWPLPSIRPKMAPLHPLRFPFFFFSTKTGGHTNKRSRRIFCVRVCWKRFHRVTFSSFPSPYGKNVFLGSVGRPPSRAPKSRSSSSAAGGAQQQTVFPPIALAVWTASSSVFMSCVYFVVVSYYSVYKTPQHSWIVKRLSP